jgi:hypothetical protein
MKPAPIESPGTQNGSLLEIGKGEPARFPSERRGAEGKGGVTGKVTPPLPLCPYASGPHL